MIKSGAVAVAYETVQLPNRELPLLTPMSEVAGRMAVQEGAKYLEKVFGGQRHPAGRRARRGAGRGRHHRRRRGRHQRGQDGRRAGRARGHPRRLARPAALPRRRAARPTWIPPTPTGTTSSTRSGGPTWWSARSCSRAPRRRTWSSGPTSSPDEAGLGHRGRGGGPGRLRRDHQADHAREPDLRRGRHPALRRGQHAGRRAPHLHARADQRHPALRRSSWPSWAGRRPAGATTRSGSGSTWWRGRWSIPAWPRPSSCRWYRSEQVL